VKLGGLFSGIGGFELAWQRNGGEVAWMCEIDRNARKVLAHRFPGVPIYEDVEQLDPAEVEPVDVLTGGSPCQGFSIAGARAGLEHGESRLFADYVRIIDGLADRGLQWAVWENVPGVLSIKNDDGERTFTHVIGALAGAGEPVRLDPKRKWNAGLVAGAGRSVAWRVLDSRHFGVPQRRRRVYATVAFGRAVESRAGRALLAVPEGVRRNPPACVTKGQAVAGGVGDGTNPSGGPIVFDWQMHSNAGTLPSSERTPALSTSKVPAVLMTMREGKPGGGKGPLLATEESLTLATGNGQTLFQPQVFRKSTRARSTEDAETWVDDGDANTLNVFDAGDTRTTHAVVEPFCIQGSVEGRSDTAGPDGKGWKQGEAYTVDTKRPHSIASASYGVRRLTPVECERLQAFPDGWTEPAGSDSARYKALGNAVTVNVPQWLFSRMLEVQDDV
jgi:DNA (cytosine-5)-methyltransferase 1